MSVDEPKLDKDLDIGEFNWYPGHIAKAEKQLKEKIKSIDFIVELRDARIPFASEHKELKTFSGNKPIITVFTKVDLADERKLDQAIEKLLTSYDHPHEDVVKLLQNSENNFLKLNLKNNNSAKALLRVLQLLSQPMAKKSKAKGLINPVFKVVVLGYPNIGKSTLINQLTKTKKAKVQNKAGVTRSQQWIDLKAGKGANVNLKLLDTPGIIPPKFYSKDQALKLALCNCLGENAFDKILVARAGLELISELYPDMDLNFDLNTEQDAGKLLHNIYDGKLASLSYE